MSKLKSGNKLCDVYNSGLEFAKKEKPNLVDFLTKNFGQVKIICFFFPKFCFLVKSIFLVIEFHYQLYIFKQIVYFLDL